MKIKNWIFVTGVPRSGTTFVGKILSAPLEVDYIHEPFNPNYGVRGLDHRYLYLRPGYPASLRYQRCIESIFRYNFRYHFSPRDGHLNHGPSWRAVVNKLLGPRAALYLHLARLNPFHKAAVIKDPIGCLLTEYLVEKFNVKPVIILRHPMAVIGSVMRLNWKMDLEPVRQQPELVADYFSDEQDFLYARRTDPVENAAALWRALNKVLLSQAKRFPSWQVITHEALSRAPVENFRKLYQVLALPWSRRIERKIISLTCANNPVEARKGRAHDFSRNSAELFGHSLKLFTLEQRKNIYEITKDIALQVYSKDSFQLDEEGPDTRAIE